MARIIALSSLVARGHVGLSAYCPVLEALGHEVTSLVTVYLSNRPGHGHIAGTRIDAATLHSMINALDANGWLTEVDTVLTGYLPSAEHVAVGVELVSRVRARRPDCRIVVDPVLGDDPNGLYIDTAAAQAIRSSLVPMADVITPNRFELSWLTGRPVATIGEAVAAARSLAVPKVVATSIPAGTSSAGVDQLATIAIDPETAHMTIAEKLANIPNGTGDAVAALLVAGMPLGRIASVVSCLVVESCGASELRLVTTLATALASPAHDELIVSDTSIE